MKNALLLLVVFVAGCGIGLTQAEKDALTPAQSIFKVASEINIAFEPAVAYALQEKCTDVVVVACHDPNVVKIMLRLREEANAALKIARGNPDAAALSVLTGVARRVLAELQRELLKVKTQGASHDRRNIIVIG